jgi:hypothetical protein
MSENSYRARYYIAKQRSRWHLRQWDGGSIAELDDATAEIARHLFPTHPSFAVSWPNQQQEAAAQLVLALVRMTADRDGEREARLAVEAKLTEVTAGTDWAQWARDHGYGKARPG